MKLLLRKDIPKLGLCGDVVEVSSGYARNYLLPHHMALEPTKSNLKAIEEDKKIAAVEREQRRTMLVETCKRLEGAEVTISSACTTDGHLYGSVGPREVSSALIEEGHSVHPDDIKLAHNFKEVGTFSAPVVLADDITAEVKVWIVAEKSLDDDEEFEDGEPGEREATDDADANADVESEPGQSAAGEQVAAEESAD